jgi:hypothetical protein
MKQKKIEHISHDINVDVILKCLWAIRENDQFYFNSYGKEMIENCIEQQLKKGLPDTVKSEIELTKQKALSKLAATSPTENDKGFILGWRKCYEWVVGSNDR